MEHSIEPSRKKTFIHPSKKFQMVAHYIAVGCNPTIASRIFSHQEGGYHGERVFKNFGISQNYSLRVRGRIHPVVVSNVYDFAGRDPELASKFLGVSQERLEMLLNGTDSKPQEQRIVGKGSHKYLDRYTSQSSKGRSSKKTVSYRSSNG